MSEKVIKYQPNRKIFDPRIIEKETNNRMWNSESVKLADNGLNNGYKLIENPYNQRIKDAALRKANLPFDYSEDEIRELKKCNKNIIYFGNNHISLKDADKGWQRITLRYYQEDVLNKYQKNRWNILMFPRQSGKTTTTIVKIVHFLTFNKDKDCVVIAQSEKVVNEILQKIKEAFNSLPFYMQPGFITFTKKGLTLDNGCRLSIGVASESVVQGFSLDLLFIDEFAYIRESMVNKFWNNIYPSLTNNPNSRCIIASTPNGRNKFYDLWTGSVNGTNKFVNSRIYWTDVPRQQSNEEFRRETIENVGIDGWLMGFECSFDVGLKSVFHTKDQQKLREWQRENEKNWSNDNHYLGTQFKDFVFMNQEVVKYDFKNDYFLIASDLSEGLEQDSTTMKVYKIFWSVQNKRLEYQLVAVYHSNETAIEDFAETSLDFLKNFNRSKIRYVVENNTYGGEYFQKVKNLILYDKRYKGFDMTMYAKFVRTSKKDYENGIRWNEDNKKLGVKSFSKLINKDIVKCTHYLSIEEYLNFGLQMNGTYKANYGHDDLVMTDVILSYYICNNDPFIKAFLSSVEYQLRIDYNDITEEEAQRRERERIKAIKNVIRISFHDKRKLMIRDHKESFNKLERGEYRAMMIDDWSDDYRTRPQIKEDPSPIYF